MKNILEKFFFWLGYIPKQDFEFKIEISPEAAQSWPFPVEAEKKKPQGKKVTVPKATTRKKPAVAAKTARTKKAK